MADLYVQRVAIIAVLFSVLIPHRVECVPTDFLKQVGESIHDFNKGILGGVQNIEKNVHDKFTELTSNNKKEETNIGHQTSGSVSPKESNFIIMSQDSFKKVGDTVNNLNRGVSEMFNKLTKGARDKISQLTHSNSHTAVPVTAVPLTTVPVTAEKDKEKVDNDKIAFQDTRRYMNESVAAKEGQKITVEKEEEFGVEEGTALTNKSSNTDSGTLDNRFGSNIKVGCNYGKISVNGMCEEPFSPPTTKRV